MGVYLYPSGTETELKNAYIGEYVPFTPGANTLAYYKMATDLLDYSGNNRNLSGTATFSSNKATNSSNLTYSGSGVLNGITGAFTVSMWALGNNGWISDRDSGGNQWYCEPSGANGYNGNFIIGGSWRRCGNNSAAGTSSEFMLLTFVYSGSVLTAYKNGTQFGTTTSITGNIKGTSNLFQVQSGTWGEIIIEKKEWTVAEISDYYNGMKSKYGL